MGTYYRGISKRTLTVENEEIAFSNFHGKAPSLFSENTGAWNRFNTRSFNTADAMIGRVHYVMMADSAKDMNELKEVPVAKWNGAGLMHDGYWDNNIVGKLVRHGRKWKIVWY